MHHPDEYIFEELDITTADSIFILRHCAEQVTTDVKGFYEIRPSELSINTGVFSNLYGINAPAAVAVTYVVKRLTLFCNCQAPKTKLCSHQAQVLFNIIQRKELRIFFDEKLRHEKFKQFAVDYGLEHEEHLDEYFHLVYTNKIAEIKPRLKELVAVDPKSNAYFETHLLPKQEIQPLVQDKGNLQTVIVFGKHKYYDHLSIDLFKANTTREGKLKNPLIPVNPFDLIWKTENSEELKFYTAISRFQHNYNTGKSDSDLEGLKAIVRNPLNLEVYYHDTAVSPNIHAASVVAVLLRSFRIDLRLSVDLKDHFYEVSGQLMLNDKGYELRLLTIRYQYFLLLSGTLYLIDNTDLLRVIEFFKQSNNRLLIHESKFETFRQNVLARLEDKIRITYSHVKQATPQQLELNGFNTGTERIIYLSDSGNYVEITPVMRYGAVEIPVLSKRQIYASDRKGNSFTVQRDDKAEIQFTTMLIRQHPHFEEQLNNDCFYLHKDRFLDADWFLDAFEDWRNEQITILGFNELANNTLNANKAKVTVSVKSGINWFDTSIDVRFGKQKVAMKHLHQSIRKKSRFIQLDDGTQGILPDEWIGKFSRYFLSGDLVDEQIRTPKINFAGIASLYEDEVLNADVKKELALFQSKISTFSAIREVEVPAGLNATLRDYQKQGLNWLSCLDEFNFGACLADDMGLGKTLQIIAFILSQRTKGHHNTNLIVVPTSLIFNWQAEVAKFAPSLKLCTIYGSNRIKDTANLDQYEIVLTSYGTLQSDIRLLKQYHFNYIILDESQAIKNPESLRYKTVRLLQARNRIVLTGTPIENNTFDLYGQLSFACPGLLGSRQYFKDIYSTPIDRFKNSKRAIELQQKINPFILRRTKEQVATELPDKTEMVIYCEMGAEQRKVYDECEKEIRDYIASQREEILPANSFYVLQGLTKLRQICNSPAILKDEPYHGDSSKIETLVEEIENKSPDHKILVFSQFVTMLDLIGTKLKEKNISFEYLTGQTRDRASKVDSFQQDQNIRVFLISLKAGGTGLNLTEADYVYLVDPWWNPAVENQAIDRSYRIGQKKNVVAVRLICLDTVESKIMKLKESKKDLANDLIKTDESVFKSLTKTDLLGLLS